MNILNKKILNSYSVLLKEDSLDDFHQWYGENLNNEYEKIICEYLKMKEDGNIKHMSWNVIPFARLKRIWEDFSRTGSARDERGLENIKDQMLNILIRLDATTNLAGHANIGPQEIFDSLGFDEDNTYIQNIIDDKDFDFYNTFLATDFEDPISDTAINPLFKIATKLYQEQIPEKQILLIDQMLDVAHQRGDLSALFVEGGRRALDVLAGNE